MLQQQVEAPLRVAQLPEVAVQVLHPVPVEVVLVAEAAVVLPHHLAVTNLDPIPLELKLFQTLLQQNPAVASSLLKNPRQHLCQEDLLRCPWPIN